MIDGGPLDRWPTERPLILSHRGNAEGARENTLEGARRALDVGADGIEIDVRTTADEVPVLHHDRRLDGTDIASTRFEELEQIAARRGYELARLRDILETVDDDTLVNVEVKAPDAAEPILETVQAWAQGPVLVTGFDPSVVRAVPDGDPELASGTILGPRRAHRLLFSRRRSRRLDRWLDGTDPEILVVHRTFLRWGLASVVFGQGRPVLTWTVNRRRALTSTISHPLLGGVITDRPSLARRLRSLAHGIAASIAPGDSPTSRRIDQKSIGSQQPG